MDKRSSNKQVTNKLFQYTVIPQYLNSIIIIIVLKAFSISLFSIPPALRKFVYFYGVRQGTPEDWEQVLKRLKSNTIASEYQPLLMGLAGTRDKWTLYK